MNIIFKSLSFFAVMVGLCLPCSVRAATGGVSAKYLNGAITLGSNANACNSGLAGSLRYISATGTLDVCNGTNWLPSFLSTQSVVTNCVAANKGALRFNTTGSTISTSYSNYVELCDGSSWIPVNPPVAAAGAGSYVQYNSAGVMGGNSNLSWNYTTGDLNISGLYAIGGNNALRLTTSGSPIVGNTAMSASIAPLSIAIGANTLAAINTEMYDTAIGYQVLQFASGGANLDVGVGHQALANETTGYLSTAFGWKALYNQTGGAEDTAVGSNAMYGINGTPLTVGFSTAIGSNALSKASGSDQYVTAIGRRAWYQTTSSFAAAVGTNAFSSATGGNGSAIGWNVYGNATNASGIGIGANAGSNIGTSTGNIMIGYNTTSPSPGTNNVLNIGNVIYAYTSNTGLAIGTSNAPGGIDFGLIAAPPATQTIAASGTITVDACGTTKAITAAGAVSTDATNTFTAPATANKGCCMDVMNVGTTNTITLKHNATFFTDGGTDKALAPYSMMRVCSTGTAWYEIAPVSTNN